ncbi:translesion DNA synthesis-associated protein ImuA [Aquincola sp. MAHUQ-54]|uniref:Translesion DNA synthesis-associated protein ImuA n=1 Tax=Aquincola agrisoli TaxID=3119538 RepID=A0AAW9QCF7_9BURK
MLSSAAAPAAPSCFPASSAPQPAPCRASPALDPAWLWRADTMASTSGLTWSTGYPALDAELPGGGWPAPGLTELLLAQPGSGELRLLAPVLRGLVRPVLWVAPPLQPHAPALQQGGLPLDGLVWARPSSDTDAVWAAEQALRSRSCAAVLWWGDAAPPVWRRLHLAAQDGGCVLWALRPAGARGQPSAAPLRLAIAPAPGEQLAVEVFKRRGPAMARPILLSLPAILPAARRVVVPTGESSHAVARAAPALVAA